MAGEIPLVEPEPTRAVMGKPALAAAVREDEPRRSWWKWLVVVVLAVALSLVGAWVYIVFISFNFHEVTRDVYRSSQPSAAFLERIAREKNLHSIIKLNNLRESGWSADEEMVSARLGIETFHIPVGVTELPARHDLVAIVKAVESAPRPVLVHCKTGADRTGVVSAMIEMREGKSLEQAEADQLRLTFLHVGHIGPEISDVFRQYREDHKSSAQLGTWEDFRAYVLKEYYPDFYHAKIQPSALRVNARAGEKVAVSVKVTNASPREWKTSASNAFVLALQQPGTGKAFNPDAVAEAAMPLSVGAGESVKVDIQMMAPTAAGQHRYLIDVVQKGITTFAHRGSDPSEVTIVVRAAASGPTGKITAKP